MKNIACDFMAFVAAAVNGSQEEKESLQEVVSVLFENLEANDPDTAARLLEKVQPAKQFLTCEEAHKIVAKMIPSPALGYDEMMYHLNREGLPTSVYRGFNSYALWAVMSSILSDMTTSLEFIKGCPINSGEMIIYSHHIAVNAYLMDVDGVYNVRDYFKV